MEKGNLKQYINIPIDLWILVYFIQWFYVKQYN